MWHPFARHQAKLIGVVDIDSSGAGAAIVSVEHGRADILWSSRTEAKIERDPSFERVIRSASEAAAKAVQIVLLRGVRPDEWHCFLSSAYVSAQTKIVSYRENQPKPVSNKLLSNMMRRGSDHFIEHNGGTDRFYLIENKLLEVRLDGYAVDQPFGHAAREIRLAEYFSGAPKEMLSRLARAVRGASGSERLHFHSYALAAWSSLRDATGSGNFIALDVSGELTDVLVSAGGVLTENISSPYGLNKIARDLAGTGVPPKMARSELEMFSTGRLHKTAEAKFERRLAVVRGRWLTHLAQALDLAQSGSALPKDVFLMGETPAHGIFEKWLASPEIRKFGFHRDGFACHYLDERKLSGGGGSGTYLLLDARYAGKVSSTIA